MRSKSRMRLCRLITVPFRNTRFLSFNQRGLLSPSARDLGDFNFAVPPQCDDHPLFAMDIIHLSLSLSPVPYLAPAFSALRLICSSVQQAKASQRQLEALAQTIAQLLSTLNTEYCAGNLLQDKTSIPLANLGRFVLGYRTFPVVCLSIFLTQVTGRNIGIY